MRNVLAVGFLFCGIALSLSAAPDSQPATTTSRPDEDSSAIALAHVALLDAMEMQDAVALRSLFHATGKASGYADDMSVLVISSIRLHKALVEKFPEQKRAIFWEPVSAKDIQATRAILPKITYRIDGDLAQPILPKDAAAVSFSLSPPFRRINHVWKVDIGAENFKDYPRDNTASAMVYMLARCTPAVDSVTADIEKGALKSVAEVEAAIEKRTALIREKVEKELTVLE